jgi:hypothetical protein
MKKYNEIKISPKIQLKESTRYPGLSVAKYKRSVFFNNEWDDLTIESRGHVWNSSGQLVVNPPTKIFNRGENGTDIALDEEVIAVQKINGFMACATYVPEVDEVVVSTTGSLDSDFVKMAEEYITDEVKLLIKESTINCGEAYTCIFEIVHPNDPHIIQEPYEGAYLIGIRKVSKESPYFSYDELEYDLDQYAKFLGVFRPHWQLCKFSDVVELSKNCKHEGFVVYGQESRTALKIKSPYYLCLKAAARKKDIMSLNKQIVDEEFYELIDHLTLNQESFNIMDEQARLDYMRKFLEN